jgi:hypothetical protein
MPQFEPPEGREQAVASILVAMRDCGKIGGRKSVKTNLRCQLTLFVIELTVRALASAREGIVR